MTSKKLSFLLPSSLLSLAAFAAAFNPLSAAVAENLHNPASGVPAPPKTAVHEVREMLYGTEIVDPYRWLEDQDSPETRAWIQAQMEYTKSWLDTLPGRDTIKQRLSELLQIDTFGIPQERRGVYFLMKRAADQDQYVLYWRKGLHGQDEVLLDP